MAWDEFAAAAAFTKRHSYSRQQIKALTGVVTAPRRALLFGDSNTFNNTSLAGNAAYLMSYGYFTQLQQQWGQRLYLDPALNKGVGGDTSADALARFDTDVMAHVDEFDVAFMLLGTNDTGHTAGVDPIDPAVTVGNITGMAERLIAAGKWVVVIAPPPRTWAVVGISDPTQLARARAALVSINLRLAEWARGLPDGTPMYLVSVWRDILDPTSTTGAPGNWPGTTPLPLLYDGTHLSPVGAYQIGRRIAEVVGPHIPPLPARPGGATDAYEATYNPSGNLLGNPGFTATTGGTNVGSSVTGDVPSGWGATKIAGTFIASEVVLGHESPSVGYDATPGNKITIDIAMASGRSSSEQFQLNSTVPLSGGKYSSGDVVYAEAELEIDNVYLLRNIALSMVDLNSSSAALFAVSDGRAGTGYEMPAARRIVFRTPRLTVSATTDRLQIGVTFTFNGSLGAATLSAKLSAVALRKVI